MLPTDAELIARCRNGEAEAWNLLIERYQRLVYSIPRKAGLDDDACADVFQHTFAKLVQHLPHLRAPDRLGPWLVITAKREAWRLSRQAVAFVQPAEGVETGDDALERVPDRGPLPEETVAQLEAQHAIRAALAELDERCRTLLTLLFYRPDPPAYAEIAAAAGVPEGSIGPTRARCLQKLRERLKHRLA